VETVEALVAAAMAAASYFGTRPPRVRATPSQSGHCPRRCICALAPAAVRGRVAVAPALHRRRVTRRPDCLL